VSKHLKSPPKATLIGGPMDGAVVDVIGVNYQCSVPVPKKQVSLETAELPDFPFFEHDIRICTYRWEMRGEEIVGVLS
jgi:hypothetical protein